MNSSTSSSDEAQWRRFFLAFVRHTIALVSGTWLAIVLIDPFDTLHLSLPLARRPVVSNQRFTHAALARASKFDSAIVGSSSAGLLDPRAITDALGSPFVNLAMDGARREEQHRILSVFVRHHPAPRTLIVAADRTWLLTPAGPVLPPQSRTSPLWMYDTDPWNDYAEVFNFHAIRHAVRQVGQRFGWSEPASRVDGYSPCTPAPEAYDPVKVHANIYGSETAGSRVAADGAGQALRTVAEVTFDAQGLAALFALVPPETEKVLIISPVHATRLWDLEAAKAGLVAGLRGTANLRVLDFRFRSSLTEADGNFWDGVHYTAEVAAQIARILGASRDPDFHSPVCRVLQ